MTQIVWTGTVDSGRPDGGRQSMRVIEGEDGRLMAEFSVAENVWIADTSMSFRDMDPAPDPSLSAHMIWRRNWMDVAEKGD